MTGIKESLYKVEERDGKIVLFKPSDPKNIPPFTNWKPIEITLKVTNKLKAGYICVGKNRWFSGNFTICCKWLGNFTVFNIDYYSNDFLMRLCQSKFDSNICGYCNKNAGLEYNDGFRVNCHFIVGRYKCNDEWGYYEDWYHKNCIDILFEKLNCNCYIERNCLESCGVCKQIKCGRHNCEIKCMRCKKKMCKKLMTNLKYFENDYFVCKDCQIMCKTCESIVVNTDYYNCNKCNANFCEPCGETKIKKYKGTNYCKECYLTIVKMCPDCKVVRHEKYYKNCENCKREVCVECRIIAHELILTANNEIGGFWTYLVCKDCVEEKKVILNILKKN